MRIGKWGVNNGALLKLGRNKGLRSRPYNVLVIWTNVGVNEKIV